MDNSLKQTPQAGGLGAGNQHAGSGVASRSIIPPQTRDLQRALLALGFSFALEHPHRKHPGLIVYFQGEYLPPGLRFRFARMKLRSLGIDPRRGLWDLCYLLAWEGHQK